MRSLVSVAGGATRAALTQHQARRNNLADVSAKDSSQETLVNLVALTFNLIIVPLVVTNSTVVWTMFTLFTFLHVFCNYRAVRSVNMDSLQHVQTHEHHQIILTKMAECLHRKRRMEQKMFGFSFLNHVKFAWVSLSLNTLI